MKKRFTKKTTILISFILILILISSILLIPFFNGETVMQIMFGNGNIEPLAEGAASGVIIDGDSAYWANSWGYLEIYPHTASNIVKQTQYANLTWKKPDNNIDIAFRFSNPLQGEKNMWLWQNISHPTEVEDYGNVDDSYTLHNIIGFSPISEPDYVDYGDIPSDNYYNGTNDQGSFNIGFDSFTWLNPEHTSAQFNYTYWGVTGTHIEDNYYFDWNKKTHLFEHTLHNNKHYYYVTNIPVKEDKEYRVKWEYNIPVNSKGKWDFMAKLSSDSISYALNNNRYIMIDPWWDSDWTYAKKVTINSSKVGATLTNFPVYVYTNADSDLNSNARADGYDIRFLNETNATEYNWELVNYSSGTLHGFVNVTSLSHTSDTIMYMYYGNDSASTDPSSNDTWDSDFKLVMHLNEFTGNFHDSTSNGYGGVLTDGDSDTDRSVAVPTGFGVDLNGDGDYIGIGANADHDPDQSDFTASCWFRHDEGTGYDCIMGKRDSADSNDGWTFARYPDSDRVYIELDYGVGSDSCDANPYDHGHWYYATFRRDYSVRESVYVNGTEDPDTVDATSHDVDCAAGFWIGDTAVNNPWDGVISEVRLTKGLARSADWINTTYICMNDNEAFLYFGTEQTEEVGITDNIAVTPNQVTWSGDENTDVWCNSTGTSHETLLVNISVADGSTRDAIQVNVSDLSTITADNIAIQFSSDNTTWGANTQSFSSGGSNITIRNGTWTNANGCYGNTPFTDSDALPQDAHTEIFIRFNLTIPADQAAATYTDNGWEVRVGHLT